MYPTRSPTPLSKRQTLRGFPLPGPKARRRMRRPVGGAQWWGLNDNIPCGGDRDAGRRRSRLRSPAVTNHLQPARASREPQRPRAWRHGAAYVSGASLQRRNTRAPGNHVPNHAASTRIAYSLPPAAKGRATKSARGQPPGVPAHRRSLELCRAQPFPVAPDVDSVQVRWESAECINGFAPMLRETPPALRCAAMRMQAALLPGASTGQSRWTLRRHATPGYDQCLKTATCALRCRLD
jgi:hypothetical protein